MIRSTIIVMMIRPISSQTAPMFVLLSKSPSLTATTSAMFEKLKYAMNWAISRKRKSRLASPAQDFVIVASTSLDALDRARAAPVERTRTAKKNERDDHDQAVHERRVADDFVGHRVAERGARDRRQQGDHGEHAERRPHRASAGRACRLPARCPAPPRSIAQPSPGSAGSHVPSRFSTIRAVMNVRSEGDEGSWSRCRSRGSRRGRCAAAVVRGRDRRRS